MIDTSILLARSARMLMIVTALAALALAGCRPQANSSNQGGDDGQPSTDATDGVAADGSEPDGSTTADETPIDVGHPGEVPDPGGGATDAAATDAADGGIPATDGEATNEGSTDEQSDGGATDSGDGATTAAADGGVDAAGGAPEEVKFPPLEPPKGLILLAKGQTVWVDKENQQIVMDGEICLTEGQLELFISEEGMKTHESVISVKAKPSTVHAGLLAVGARQGTPVKYEPEYAAATGEVIDIKILWWDRDGKPHEARGQDFVRNFKTKKKLKHEWVFAGSSMWKDEFTGQVSYMADSAGDFICVSNFNSAMMDLPIESSANNDGLSYEAFTENVPPRGTKVRVILTPMPKASDRASDKPDDASQDGAANDSVDKPADAVPATKER